jgi:hypothetical protein
LGELVFLIVGIWGVGASVRALGASGGASLVASLSVLTFSNLVGHVAVGFNPKILLFTMLAWGPWLVARRRFAWSGAAAAAAMLCWQPAASACAATALAAVAGTRRLRALVATVAGGIAAFAIYELYFAWHGALAAQLFQSWVLPLGSVHEAHAWLHGWRFVIFGLGQGIDRFGIPAISFLLFALGALARVAGLSLPPAGREAAPAPAVVLVVVGGSIMSLFTAYEHQGEPDRFLLVAYYAIAFGVVVDRILGGLRTKVGDRASGMLAAALVVFLVLFVPRREYREGTPSKRLSGQLEAAAIVAMTAEAYGSAWSYGCYHLFGLAHLPNHHPLDHIWDDLRRYVDEATFEPLAHGRMPDVIVACRRLPGGRDRLKQYTSIQLPGLPERAALYVRSSALAVRRKGGNRPAPAGPAPQREAR